MKLNATNKNTLKSIVIIFLILCALGALRTSGYHPVEIEMVSDKSLFDQESREDCLGTAYYSDSRGGICGGQKVVADQASYRMK